MIPLEAEVIPLGVISQENGDYPTRGYLVGGCHHTRGQSDQDTSPAMSIRYVPHRCCLASDIVSSWTAPRLHCSIGDRGTLSSCIFGSRLCIVSCSLVFRGAIQISLRSRAHTPLLSIQVLQDQDLPLPSSIRKCTRAPWLVQETEGARDQIELVTSWPAPGEASGDTTWPPAHGETVSRLIPRPLAVPVIGKRPHQVHPSLPPGSDSTSRPI